MVGLAMNTPVRIVAALLLWHAIVTSVAAAQPPVHSFADLQPLITTGERLVVRDKSGRTTHGQLVALSASDVEIRRRRWFFRTEHKT
jgi:hypothetical protein